MSSASKSFCARQLDVTDDGLRTTKPETQILDVFQFMKAAKSLRETQFRSIEFSVSSSDKPCYLVPIGEFEKDELVINSFENCN